MPEKNISEKLDRIHSDIAVLKGQMTSVIAQVDKDKEKLAILNLSLSKFTGIFTVIGFIVVTFLSAVITLFIKWAAERVGKAY